jgi:hypothetical protein
VTRSLRRLLTATRALVRDARIPRPLRWLIAVGILPLPGPLDEVALLAGALVLTLFYRGPLGEAWRQARLER